MGLLMAKSFACFHSCQFKPMLCEGDKIFCAEPVLSKAVLTSELF